MAVYKTTYRRYEGRLTPQWSRFLVLPRHSFEQMHRSRFFSMFFLVSFIWPLVCAFFIYLHHNLSALKLFDIDPSKLIAIDSRFFLFYLGFQSMIAFFMTAFVGPGLISPDLANNALPLYLARPFSRREYVLGKMSVLLILLSLMTWAPGLLLYALQSYLAGEGWMTEHARVAGGLFLGSWIWILLLSLLALALSAWVRWKPVAGALLFVVFFLGMGFGNAINRVLETKWGHLINLSHLIGSVWIWLFEQPLRRGAGAVFFRVQRGEEIPIWCIWSALLAICLLCLYVLARRIRGMEVAR